MLSATSGRMSVGTIPFGARDMTVALTGLALYLFCVHSFKLPLASVGIGIALFGVLFSGESVKFPAPLMFLTGFLLWTCLGLATSAYQSQVSLTVTDFAKIVLIAFVAFNATSTLSRLTLLIGMWVLLFGLYPSRGTYFNFFFGGGVQDRYSWNFSFRNPNDLAALTILIVGLSGFLALGRYPRWVRLLAVASAAGNAMIIIITQSRGALVGLVVGTMFLLLRSRNRVRLIRFGAIAALGITLYAPASVWERFSRMKFLQSTETLGEADSSAAQRYIIFQIAKQISKEHLAYGVGLGAYSLAHSEYAEERVEWRDGRGERDAHNMYLSVLAETGVPGLLLFLGFLGSALRYAMQTEKSLRETDPVMAEQLRVLRFALVAYLIDAVFGSFHKTSFLYVYTAVMWSAAVIAAKSAGGMRPQSTATMPELSPVRRSRSLSFASTSRGAMRRGS
jgi:O-antigen ligase